jgi:glycosyltransferase involved in cell wall biosynthesis
MSPTRPYQGPACDVVICCTDSSEATAAAVASALDQRGASPFVHVVDDGGGAGILRRFGDVGNVIPHSNPSPIGLFRTLHNLVPHLRTEFLAVQDARTTSLAHRIAHALERMNLHGGDVFASALRSGGSIVPPRPPGPQYDRYVAPQTLVLRRAALVDMGGFSDRDDADAELVYRANREGRVILLGQEPLVEHPGDWRPGPVGPAPRYTPGQGTLRHHAPGFPGEKVECDVVLPFYGQVDFLNEAVGSILAQEGADVVVHLIDDASPEDSAETLRYWGSHASVRTYRNARNIGQFASFNNVVKYLETRLVAIQDADDISLPHRLALAGNSLRLADADIFGGRGRVFGDAYQRSPRSRPGRLEMMKCPEYSTARNPVPGVKNFMHNATAVLRVGAVETLRGFANFGDVQRNKSSIDTELYMRAYWSGARFFISRDVVVDYRRHRASATQDSLTGFGSVARAWADVECDRRYDHFRSGPFNPRAFGALNEFSGITVRV